MASREGEFLVDLECGDTTSEEEGSGDSVCGSNRGRKTLSKICSGALSCNTLISGDTDTNSSDNFSKLSDVDKGTGTGGEDCRDLAVLLEKKNPNEKQKKPSSKKACKPPRPPKGPLLSASDLKLVRELSELASRKRERMQRMKALRKKKEAKRPSSSSNLMAMAITVLFFIVIILQGVFSRNNASRDFPGSPAPATASEGLISIQVFNNAPAYEMNQPVSLSLNSLELASGSSPQEQEGRDAV